MQIEMVRLGRTGLHVTRTAFGALPIQRVSPDKATAILRRAYDAGINFFDTARGYTDSEEKLGRALGSVRHDVVLATKSGATDRATLLEHLETSLRNLNTDYIDILQLHNPKSLPDPNDPESSYAGLLEAQQKGMIRFIGITNHALQNALDAAASELYDTIQFPLSALSSEQELTLAAQCRGNDLGLIAMKALCGGLLTDVAAAFAFLRQFDNVVPIWGIQRLSELDQFLELERNAPPLDDAMWRAIENDRQMLGDDYCRGCGYCLPCPQGIHIPIAARMAFLLRRAPTAGLLTPERQEGMRRINDCTGCLTCRERCPYDLDAPALLKKMLADYESHVETQER
jgi:uncharacterized protein